MILKMYRCSFDKKRVEILILPFLIGFSAKDALGPIFLCNEILELPKACQGAGKWN